MSPLLLIPVVAGCDVGSITSMSGARPVSSSPGSSSPESSSPGSSSPASAPPTGTGTGTAEPAIAPSVFAAGAITRTVPVGGMQLVVRYWTTAAPATWTYADPVQISSSASVTGGSTEQSVLVTGYHADLVCGDRVQQLRADSGEFVVSQPYSYGSAFTVQCPMRVDSAQLQVEYDLAVRTGPSSSAPYSRQTAVDSFDLTFPGDDTASVTP